jgi:hypothetical protein
VRDVGGWIPDANSVERGLRHIDLYVRIALTGSDMLKSYEGVQISE